jgi:hypothetical protein
MRAVKSNKYLEYHWNMMEYHEKTLSLSLLLVTWQAHHVRKKFTADTTTLQGPWGWWATRFAYPQSCDTRQVCIYLNIFKYIHIFYINYTYFHTSWIWTVPERIAWEDGEWIWPPKPNVCDVFLCFLLQREPCNGAFRELRDDLRSPSARESIEYTECPTATVMEKMSLSKIFQHLHFIPCVPRSPSNLL